MINTSIGDEKMYDDLRRYRFSLEKATTRVSDAVAKRGRPRRGHRDREDESGSYYEWSVGDLRKRAKQLGMTGYSALTKEELIYRLRYR